MQTEAVMARYRALKGEGLSEASIQVRKEAQQKGQQHWHRLYERCWCGHLTVPSKYYEYKDGKQVGTQAQAEKAFLSGGVDRDTEMIQRYVPTGVVPTTDVPTCECGKPREGRYTSCSACRKAAYRERSK